MACPDTFCGHEYMLKIKTNFGCIAVICFQFISNQCLKIVIPPKDSSMPVLAHNLQVSIMIYAGTFEYFIQRTTGHNTSVGTSNKFSKIVQPIQKKTLPQLEKLLQVLL
jgi:hypothetical protein